MYVCVCVYIYIYIYIYIHIHICYDILYVCYDILYIFSVILDASRPLTQKDISKHSIFQQIRLCSRYFKYIVVLYILRRYAFSPVLTITISSACTNKHNAPALSISLLAVCTYSE